MDNKELVKLFYEKLASFTPADLEASFREAEDELETLGFFDDFSHDIVEYYSSNNILVFIKKYHDKKHSVLNNKLFWCNDFRASEKIRPNYQTLVNHYIGDIDSISTTEEWVFLDKFGWENVKTKEVRQKESINVDSDYSGLFNLDTLCSYQKVGLVVNS